MPARSRLSLFLRTARKRRILTQRAIAARLGCSSQWISQWETDERLPPIHRIDEIAEVYGVDPLDLAALIETQTELVASAAPVSGDESLTRALARAAAEQRPQRPLVVHAFSTMGFTGAPGGLGALGDAFLDFVDGGGHVVFFCLAGGVGSGGTDISPDEAARGLAAAIDELVFDRSRRGRTPQHVREQIWIVRPPAAHPASVTGSAPDTFDPAGALLGTFARLITLIGPDPAEDGLTPPGPRAAQLDELVSHATGHATTGLAPAWPTLLPPDLRLHGSWIGIDAGARWIDVERPAGLEQRYVRWLASLVGPGGAVLTPLSGSA